jgi:DNA-binding NtrC family response regulator
MIEAALAESHGRISGPSGAAAKLKIPRQTLESKIRSLGIKQMRDSKPNRLSSAIKQAEITG